MKVRKYCSTLLFCIFFLMTFSMSAWAVERCIVCGMDVSEYPHTHYVVKTADGKAYVTCGVQCGLTLHLRFKNKWKSATASDLLSNRPFDVKKGFYVYKSTVITDMAPGFISFKRKVNAEKFAKGFGGRVVTYQEALEIWKKQMQQ
jgi:DeoR family transcriptional regulator, copper-sensing transcriptional repressor